MSPPDAAAPEVAWLRVELLGPPRVWVHEDELVVDTRKAIALLAYLAVTGRPQPRGRLVRLLWPEADPEHGRAALRRTLSALNKGLGGRWLIADRSAVRLTSDAVFVDLAAFANRLTAARAANDRDGRLAALTAAVMVVRGEFLEGFGLRDSPEFDDWQFFTAESVRRDLAGALEALVDGCVEVGDLHAAVAHARRWLALDVLHEPAHRTLMRLYAWTGRREAALRQYRECLRALHRELGVAPLAETNDLYQGIKEGQLPAGATLGARAAAGPPLTGTIGAAGAEAAAAGVVPVAGRASPPVLAGARSGVRLPLVGRAGDLAVLGRAHTAARWGGLVVLEGEPGIGKSRLAEELVTDTARAGAGTVLVRCYEGEQHLAYSAVVELVRGVLTRLPADAEVPGHWWAEAARLLPELAVRAPGGAAASDEAPGSSTRLFTALTGLVHAGLAGEPPGVLVIDDAHWLDPAGLDLLTYVVHRLEGVPLLVVLVWRAELVEASPRLRRLRDEVEAADHGIVRRLERLDSDAVAELAGATGVPATADLVRRIMDATEGVPLFAVHYLAALVHGEENAWLEGDVAPLLSRRVAATDETARQLLTTAAVIGRWFDADTLRAASGRTEEETVEGLERLVAAGLVREGAQPGDTTGLAEGARGAGADGPLEAGGYDFTHARLRDHVLATAGLARQRLLHRRVAAALETHARGRRETPGLRAQIGRHLRAAGDETAAAHAYRRAGEVARRLHAPTEALGHFEAALALGHPDAAGLSEQIGDLRLQTGDYHDAAQRFETAAALAGPERLAVLEHKLAGLHQRVGAWELAQHHLDTALRRLETAPDSGPRGLRTRVTADASVVAHARGDGARARTLAEAALAQAEEDGDAVAQAQARNLLGILELAAGRPEAAVAQLDAGRALARQAADEAALAAASNNLALAHRTAGSLELALAPAEEAAALTARGDDRHREATASSNLADVLRALDRADEAELHRRRCAALLAELGAVEPPRPEIWRLTNW